MPTKFTRHQVTPQQINPALLRYAELNGQKRAGWLDRSVDRYLEAWLVGLILAASLACRLFGN